jgi:hypothetical protein
VEPHNAQFPYIQPFPSRVAKITDSGQSLISLPRVADWVVGAAGGTLSDRTPCSFRTRVALPKLLGLSARGAR